MALKFMAIAEAGQRWEFANTKFDKNLFSVIKSLRSSADCWFVFDALQQFLVEYILDYNPYLRVHASYGQR